MAKNDKAPPPQIDELEGRGWQMDEVQDIADIIALRKDLGDQEKRITATKKDLNERATNLLLLHGETSVACSLGTLSFRTAERRTVDNAALQQELAMRGVPVDVIAASIEAATRLSVVNSVEFKAARE